MAAFTTVMSTTSTLDDSIVLLFEQSFMIANAADNVFDQLVTHAIDIGAKSIQITRYDRLAAATTPLVETDDIVSAAITDTAITLTPVEYGNAVTKTKLASLQTGGKLDLAAPQLVGMNSALTQEMLAIAALNASSNAYIIGGTAAGSVAGTQVASRAYMNYFYNKLARLSIPRINGDYIAVLHDDVINDLRSDTAVGSWIDVNKYSNATEVFQNEVGTFAGFRILRGNNATYGDQTGAGTVDLYNSYFLGFNGLGKATSLPVHPTITGPFDKLGRFVNIGWHGVFQYKIIDTDAVWVGQSASSVGVNAA